MTTEVLSSLIVKNLNDRLYEKRKIAALDIEKLIRDSQAASDNHKVKSIIITLVNDFTYSTAPNAKNGGLIALAAVAIALGPNVSDYCDDIVPPILSCLADPDTRVRYYACESMYNVVKIARTDILKFFNEIFDALSKVLSADTEVSVKSGAELLDRLIKDIVAEATIYYNPEFAAEGYNELGVERTESDNEVTSDYHVHPLAGPAPPVPGTYPLLPGMLQDTFNLPRFIPMLAERIHTRNPFTRMFLVQWIFTLDQIPDLELIAYLPDFLDGLFDFLSDPNVDVRMATLNVLGEFLKEIGDVIEIQKERGFLRIKGKNSRQVFIIKENASDSEEKVSLPVKTKLQSPPPYTHVAREDQTTEVTENSEIQESGRESVNSAIFATNSEHNSLSDQTGRSYKIYEGVILDFGRMVDILAPHLSSSDEETQATALRWINDFILLAKEIMLPSAPMLINAILPSLAHAINPIRNIAAETNANLYKLIWETPSGSEISTNNSTGFENAAKEHFDYQPVVKTLTLQFQNEHEETRIASMEWLLMLHRKLPRKVIDDTTFSALLKALSDTSEEVVRRDLELLAQISQISDSNYFSRFILNMLTLFSTDRRLLETRGSLIIRQLCLSLEPERIYRTFSEILEKDEVLDLEFVSTMVQNLNIILITAPELLDLRRRLRNLDSRDGTYLFTTLYKSWCHNPVAAFSLCLLAQAYEHAANLLQIFAELEISVNFLIQIDKLVQLLESPVFTYLRLQLLEPDKYPHLFKCLYGILMLLPQSSAFATLRNRLNSVSSMVMLYASNGYIGQNSMANQNQYMHTQPQQVQPQPQVNSATSVPLQAQVKNSQQSQHKSKYGTSPTNMSSGMLYSQQISQQNNDTHLRWQELLLHFRGIQSHHERYRRNGVRNSGTSLNQNLSRQRRTSSFQGDVSAESLGGEEVQLEFQKSTETTLMVAANPAPIKKSRPRSASVSSSSSSRSSQSVVGVNAGSQTNVGISINDEVITRPILTSRASGSSLLISSVPKRETTSRSSGTAGNMVSGIVKKITGGSSLGSPSRK
ncbi:hypothetical protein HK096_004313 [Nowakowskiella sp. JEL0078]|nr:hypothetical protein HK096_004313 [Nowakowskiella sp. JEL0078]